MWCWTQGSHSAITQSRGAVAIQGSQVTGIWDTPGPQALLLLTPSPSSAEKQGGERAKPAPSANPKCQPLLIPRPSLLPSHPASPYPCRALQPDQTALAGLRPRQLNTFNTSTLFFCRVLKSNPGFSQPVSALLLPSWVRGLWLLSSVC